MVPITDGVATRWIVLTMVIGASSALLLRDDLILSALSIAGAVGYLISIHVDRLVTQRLDKMEIQPPPSDDVVESVAN